MNLAFSIIPFHLIVFNAIFRTFAFFSPIKRGATMLTAKDLFLVDLRGAANRSHMELVETWMAVYSD